VVGGQIISDPDGTLPDMGALFHNKIPTAIIEPSHLTNFSLSQNYPNPFNPTTTIAYDLQQMTFVTLTIYNTLGQEVRTLVNTQQTAGSYQVKWDGKNDSGNALASGVYLYRLRADDYMETKKMVLMK
jgi:hypothetical protein